MLRFESSTLTANGLYTPRIFWLFGAMYAWNPQYLDRIGGMKHTLIEDITLALEAHLDGIHTQHIDATIWGFNPSSITDIVSARIRLYQGYLQLKNLTKGREDAVPAIEQNDPINKPFVQRMQIALSEIWTLKAQPKNRLKHTARVAFREYCQIIARYHHWKNPTAQTWAQIRSSK